jgi:hypothetical protein
MHGEYEYAPALLIAEQIPNKLWMAAVKAVKRAGRIRKGKQKHVK